MTSTPSLNEYQALRGELDAAYAEPAWDSQRIDRIAEQLACLERALASHRVRASAHDDGA